MKLLITKITKHPLGALYGALLGIVALFAAVPMFGSGMWDAALVDLALAAIFIGIMFKKFTVCSSCCASVPEKCAAWGLLFFANILAVLPFQNFPGSLNTALAFTLLIGAAVLYFSGRKIALICLVPALWCGVFMPYHEEFMLMLSYPLRLSATMLSASLLKLCGIGVVYAGTSLNLPGVDIAITDACSGINQLDAFILIAFVMVQILHKKAGWKILHFAFIMPAIIIGNSLRIVLTVLLYRQWGECVLLGNWHIALGYVQIILALAVFIAVGRLFAAAATEEKP
ncbi:MAG: exosortase/archaeosortase family protein [Lentisphaerae bacterium]|nr:exosortase/archaeosortase family protein [Lentisphaerota bacterium]